MLLINAQSEVSETVQVEVRYDISTEAILPKPVRAEELYAKGKESANNSCTVNQTIFISRSSSEAGIQSLNKECLTGLWVFQLKRKSSSSLTELGEKPQGSEVQYPVFFAHERILPSSLKA